ncbi:MAG: TolB-like protein [Hyphomicrobiaceae bacterium]|jgi:TolB-like protein
MGNFFAELRRRHIYRIGAGYVVVAWGITQILDVLSQLFALPDWIAQPAVIVLAIGFPVTLTVAWLIEGKAHEAVASAVRSKATTVDWLLLGAVALVLAAIGYQQFAPSVPQQIAVETVRQDAASPVMAVSVAVLPFANMSNDPEQQFFSDGMTEEISFALAKVADLRVVARTSAFQFREQDRDFQTIGQALNATHFIDGSVRQEGERVRITARLIEADNSTQLWAENYDRELTDVFAIQEEIATAIATSLQVPLGLNPGESLVPNRAANLESYQDYLRARSLIRARGPREPGGPITEAIALLEQVVASDPDFAPAWATLGYGYVTMPLFSEAYFGGSIEEQRRLGDETLPNAEASAQQALRLDPTNAVGYAALAFVQQLRGNLIQAHDFAQQALALDPGNPEALQTFSGTLVLAGRRTEALVLRQRLQAIEPFVPVFNAVTADFLHVSDQEEAALAMFVALPEYIYMRAFGLAQVHAAAGRFVQAADALQSMPPDTFPPAMVEAAAALLRSAPAQTATPQDLPRLGPLSFVYLYVGAIERALEPSEEGIEAGLASLLPMTNHWSSSSADLRSTERFKTYIRNAGIYDYWLEHGWSDLCRPIGPDDDNDFECD